MSSRVSVIVLTMGDRPEALSRAIESVANQRHIDTELIVVLNTSEDVDVPGADVVVRPMENVGIPEGRNRGAAVADFDVLFFLDDDAALMDDGLLSRATALMENDPKLAVVACRIVDESGRTARRHVPRIGSSGAERPGPVAGFLGGAVLIRAEAFHRCGGLDGRFRYSMEETDLAWRLVDDGWRIWYEPECAVYHPATVPSRHANQSRTTARNRVWAAWKSLPLLLLPVYLAAWTVIPLLRRESFRAVAAGTADGWRSRPGDRSPMGWSTVLRLTRLGRPPIV